MNHKLAMELSKFVLDSTPDGVLSDGTLGHSWETIKSRIDEWRQRNPGPEAASVAVQCEAFLLDHYKEQ